MFPKDINRDDRYTYNDNGRIVIPNNDYIKNLPKDGGELWNRLIFESSPYLLQHAANPVDWYPWSKEAFDKAKELNKPIFLSIGYTTCHWCHVMEHESFENQEVAKLMNDAFVNVKVDREERPDIDNVYMEVTQQLSGRGGWPMTVIMTPNKEPFFAGTYFPKESLPNYKRVGMLELVPTIKSLWEAKEDSLIISAKNIVSNLDKSNKTRSNLSKIQLKKTVLEDSFNMFYKKFDDTYGGFSGGRNKFPKPHDYSFLIKYYYATKDSRALKIVNKSLYAMKNGGIYDQIGFGFHRYSTDKKWLVPHFEKMLYDQAMLIHAYLDAYLVTSDPFFQKTIIEVCEYILRDMTSPEGGFYSAEDADSEGEEGVFYIWNNQELKNILNDEEYEFISKILNIKDDGNSIVERKKTNIPHFTIHLEEVEFDNVIFDNFNESQLNQYYQKVRQKIFFEREKRVHPQKDDKILTDWNGLMIAALARAGAVLDNEVYLEAAEKSAHFIIDNLIESNGKLLKRYRNNNAGIDGMIEDYAFFIWGLIELYQSTFDYKYIKIASNLADYQLNHFWDKDNNGFYFTSDLSEELIIRSKEVYDGAIPSGNSVSVNNYLRLGRILSRPDYEDIAYKTIYAFAPNLNRYGIGSSMMLQAINFMNGPSYEVIVAGDKKKSTKILQTLQKNPQFNKVIILKDKDYNKKLFNFLEFYNSKENGSPLVYVCQDYTCDLPTDDIAKITEMLK